MNIKRRDILKLSIATIALTSIHKTLFTINKTLGTDSYTGIITKIGESSYLIDGWVIPDIDLISYEV